MRKIIRRVTFKAYCEKYLKLVFCSGQNTKLVLILLTFLLIPSRQESRNRGDLDLDNSSIQFKRDFFYVETNIDE